MIKDKRNNILNKDKPVYNHSSLDSNRMMKMAKKLTWYGDNQFVTSKK